MQKKNYWTKRPSKKKALSPRGETMEEAREAVKAHSHQKDKKGKRAMQRTEAVEVKVDQKKESPKVVFGLGGTIREEQEKEGNDRRDKGKKAETKGQFTGKAMS